MDIWTPERDARLKELWAEGLSYSLIGRDLGLTRSAISGRVSRLGMSNSKVKRAPIVKNLLPSLTRAEKAERQRNNYDAKVMGRRLEPRNSRPQKVGKGFQHLTLNELEFWHCRFPHGEGPYTFCGCVKMPGSPYCAEHHALTHGAQQAATPEQIARAAKMRAARWRKAA